MKGCWGIGRPERADLVLEMPVATAERGLVFIPLLDPQLVLGIAQVDLGEDLGAMQAIQHLKYEG